MKGNKIVLSSLEHSPLKKERTEERKKLGKLEMGRAYY
jgi:hypothetical protein